MLVNTGGCIGHKQDPNVLKARGANLFEKAQYDEALKAYEGAIDINLRDSDAWISKGQTLNK
jgi:Flp pilus assembly protein TadD